MDLGLHSIGKTKYYASKKFFTVADIEDGEDVWVYEHPSGESKKDIRIAIAATYISDWRKQNGEYKVVGRYPNYRIEKRA